MTEWQKDKEDQLKDQYQKELENQPAIKELMQKHRAKIKEIKVIEEN